MKKIFLILNLIFCFRFSIAALAKSVPPLLNAHNVQNVKQDVDELTILIKNDDSTHHTVKKTPKHKLILFVNMNFKSVADQNKTLFSEQFNRFMQPSFNNRLDFTKNPSVNDINSVNFKLLPLFDYKSFIASDPTYVNKNTMPTANMITLFQINFF